MRLVSTSKDVPCEFCRTRRAEFFYYPFDGLPFKSPLCSHCLCPRCLQRPRRAEHHKDGNHKNNDPRNIVKLCILCHADHHGISAQENHFKFLMRRKRWCIKNRVMQAQKKFNAECAEQVPMVEYDLVAQIWKEAELRIDAETRAFIRHARETKAYETPKIYRMISCASFLASIEGIAMLG